MFWQELKLIFLFWHVVFSSRLSTDDCRITPTRWDWQKPIFNIFVWETFLDKLKIKRFFVPMLLHLGMSIQFYIKQLNAFLERALGLGTDQKYQTYQIVRWYLLRWQDFIKISSKWLLFIHYLFISHWQINCLDIEKVYRIA